MILADTNILLRLAQPAHPHFRPATEAVNLLSAQAGQAIGIATQSLYEMYVVLTRPVDVNGFGWSPDQAQTELRRAISFFQLFPETDSIYQHWEDLVVRYNVVGKSAHDARLVALMNASHMDRLLTFNDRDFSRFAEITVINPFDVLGLPRA
jgi:predicted nucleic acid-binding protein